jgi:Transposase DDE domain group 1
MRTLIGFQGLMLQHGPRSAPPYLRPLKKKGFKEERVTTIGLDDIGTSTTLESNKSLDAMQAELAPPRHLAPVGDKAVAIAFAGGRLSSDAGLVLLQAPDEPLGFTRALAAVLPDPRDPRRVHLPLHDRRKQRVRQIAAG